MTSLFDHSGSSASAKDQSPVTLFAFPTFAGTEEASAVPNPRSSFLSFLVIGQDVSRAAAEGATSAATFQAEAATQQQAAQTRVLVQAAREEAVIEARRGWQEELEVRLTEERERVLRVSGDFARDRQRYFAAAETQVIRLALAMARRVLGREITTDPTDLSAVVHAALKQVQHGSVTTLHVRPEVVEAWKEIFTEESHAQVVVAGEENMCVGECVLETRVGRVDLGVESQMQEIQRSFEELLQAEGT